MKMKTFFAPRSPLSAAVFHTLSDTFRDFVSIPTTFFFFTLPPSLVLKPHGPFLLLPTYPLNAAVKFIRFSL